MVVFGTVWCGFAARLLICVRCELQVNANKFNLGRLMITRASRRLFDLLLMAKQAIL